MKRASITLNIILLVIIVVLISNNINYSKAISDNSAYAEKETQSTESDAITTFSEQETVYGTIDYPLLEIPIRFNEAELTLIIVNNIMQFDQSEYLITSDKEVLEKMQMSFNIISYPVDRGTTPDSMVYIYQDKTLLKEMPFSGAIEHNDYQDLSILNKEQVETIIGQELPPAF